MKKKHHSEEQIVAILREADEGRSVEDVCREHNISKASFHRWKSKYGQMELRDVKRLKELERENAELKKIVADQLLNIKVLEHVNAKKMVSPGHKRDAVREVAEAGVCSLRRACRCLHLHWSSFCYRAKTATAKMVRLVKAIIDVSRANPRYGYRRIRALLANDGWQVSLKLVQKVRWSEGLGVKPPKPRQRRQGQSTEKIPTEATRPNHVWSWDFVADRTDNGAPLRVLSLIDEFTRQCISLTVARSLKAEDIVAALDEAVAQRGAPANIRSDNGPEFIANATKDYLKDK